MLNDRKKKILKRAVMLIIIMLFFIIIGFSMLKYEVEGEKNMPFQLTKISIISTANGIPNTETLDRWNFNLVQNNDIYFNFEKNENYKEQESINKISIENIKVLQNPLKGTTYFYRPSQQAVDWYENIEEARVTDKVEYQGNETSNVKELQVSNQGGIVGIRFAIEDLGTYVSEEEQITHDGLLLKSIGLKQEELKSKIAFDLVLELNSGIRYKAYIEQELPLDSVLGEGISKKEITDLNYVAFKRF